MNISSISSSISSSRECFPLNSSASSINGYSVWRIDCFCWLRTNQSASGKDIALEWFKLNFPDQSRFTNPFWLIKSLNSCTPHWFLCSMTPDCHFSPTDGLITCSPWFISFLSRNWKRISSRTCSNGRWFCWVSGYAGNWKKKGMPMFQKLKN